MLGLEDPGEPAPWQAGGQWHQSDSDAPDVVATRANTDAVGESTEQQFSLVEQLTDLNNSLRRLLGLGGAGAGGGGAQIMQASFGGGGRPRRDFGAGAAAGAPVGPWAAAEDGGGGSLAASISGGGGSAGGGGATGGWTAPAAPAAPAQRATRRRRRRRRSRRSGLRQSEAPPEAVERGGGRGDLYAQRAPMIMADLKRELGLTHEQAAGLVGNLGYESAGFKALQEGRPISGAGGFGYAQWTGPRRTQVHAIRAAATASTPSRTKPMSAFSSTS